MRSNPNNLLNLPLLTTDYSQMFDGQYTSRLIASIVGGRLTEGSQPDNTVFALITDSRKPVAAESDLFIALKTSRDDGHNYVHDLLLKGLRNFIVSSLRDEWLNFGANFIVVENTLQALQQLAAWHRSRFNIPVIGITGSNGKTIVKEWLWQLIDGDKQVVKSPKSYNSQIGVPLSVWQMHQSDELAIFEAGISMPGEMERLEKIIRPTIGIFTNIGPAHDENFSTVDQKIREKLLLFRHAELLLCCLDHQQITEACHNPDWPDKPKLVTWSRYNAQANLWVSEAVTADNKTILKGCYQGVTHQICIPFTDDASVDNAITCWLTLLVLGFDPGVIGSRFNQLQPVAMRMELKEGVNQCSLIDDSYSCDLASLRIALDFLAQQRQHSSKSLIISDIQQTGLQSETLYGALAKMIATAQLSRLIGIGPTISRHRDLFPAGSLFFDSTDSFLTQWPEIGFSNESILIKGARVFGFERIVSVLQQKKHDTVLEINLDGLLHNLNHYKAFLEPGVKLMAMVKAFSYGSGSFEIANLLQYHRTDYLAVAYTDEGVELRNAGIHLPVMVMNPEESGIEDLFTYRLEPEVYNFRSLELLKRAWAKRINQMTDTLNIHVKVDTGMRRLGFEPDQIPVLVKELNAIPGFRVKSVFSHLAASENPDHDDFTRIQIDCFRKVCYQMEQLLGYGFLKHILNSAGIARFPDAQFDMVRLGIGLYGIADNPREQAFLQPVSTLKSIISQIKYVRKGESVGYGRQHVANCDQVIAVVPIGYADGLSRSLSNGRFSLLVGDRLAPIVGNISMDMCMIDITGIPASEGDEVIVFSPSYPITHFAAARETIPYEVLTSISRRVKRVYFRE